MSYEWRDDKSSAECLSHLCLKESLADVHFVFRTESGLQRLPAHRFVLAMRSSVFEAMFYGGLRETSGEVVIEDIEISVFQELLRFIYKDEVTLDNECALPCLYAAKKYLIDGLTKQCVNHLVKSLSVDNVCTIMNQAEVFQEKKLTYECLHFVCKNAPQVLKSKDFLNLSHLCLQELLAFNNLFEKELTIFEATLSWARYQCQKKNKSCTKDNLRQALGDLFSLIRFPLIPLVDFTTKVVPTALLAADEELHLYRSMTAPGQGGSSGDDQKFSSVKRFIGYNPVIRPNVPEGTAVYKDRLRQYGLRFIEGCQLSITTPYKIELMKVYLKINRSYKPRKLVVYKLCEKENKYMMVETCGIIGENIAYFSKGWKVFEPGITHNIKFGVKFHQQLTTRKPRAVDMKARDLDVKLTGATDWVHSMNFLVYP